MQMPALDLFPKVGFIVDQVAAGFIYYTDSKVAIIDNYITNPRSDADERDEALNLITQELIGNAAFHGCTLVKCDTVLDIVKKRAMTFGFKSIGHFESFIKKL